MKKITDYNKELDVHYERMQFLSKNYVVFQIGLTILIVLGLFFLKDARGYIAIPFVLSYWVFIFIHTKIQTVITLYLKDRNVAIYNNYASPLGFVRGYYPLRKVTLIKLSKNDLNEIKDLRIAQLIRNVRLSFKVLIICQTIVIPLIFIMAYYKLM